jgi:peptidoglycan/xylan/chitin deacetylase (PgdA/CDA1 family)
MSSLKSALKSLFYTLWRALIPWRNRPQAIVLAYHSISYDRQDPYAVTPEEFAWQLEELLREGFTVARVTELERMLAEGKIPPRTAIITLDDGRKDNFAYAFPILTRLNLPATIFCTTGSTGTAFNASQGAVATLSADEIQMMQQSSIVDFEPHSVTHPKLTRIPIDAAREEIAGSKRALEELLHKPCPYFAYPKGRWNEEVAAAARAAGITLAFAMGGGVVTAERNPLALPRSDITAHTTRAIFRGILAHGALR